MKRNEKIRAAARRADVRLWQVAEQAGISESCLMKWLRLDLEPEREARIMAAIEELSKEGRSNG